jgi:hypothetical protein
MKQRPPWIPSLPSDGTCPVKISVIVTNGDAFLLPCAFHHAVPIGSLGGPVTQAKVAAVTRGSSRWSGGRAPERQGQPPPPTSWPVNGGGSAAFGLPAWRLMRMNAAEVSRASSSFCASLPGHCRPWRAVLL